MGCLFFLLELFVKAEHLLLLQPSWDWFWSFEACFFGALFTTCWWIIAHSLCVILLTSIEFCEELLLVSGVSLLRWADVETIAWGRRSFEYWYISCGLIQGNLWQLWERLETWTKRMSEEMHVIDLIVNFHMVEIGWNIVHNSNYPVVFYVTA